MMCVTPRHASPPHPHTQVLRDLEVVRLDKRIEGLDFLRGLLGPNSVGLMKGKRARERRQLLHNVGD